VARANPAIELLQYASLRGVSALCHAFPTDPNLATARMVAKAFAALGPSRVARAVSNLQSSFPELPARQVDALARRSIEHMFEVFMVDSVATPRLLGPTNWIRHVHLGSIRSGLELLLSSRPAIFITGHFGNWELLGFVLATIGFPLHAVARPLDNPWINRWLLSVREARGMRILTKWGAVPELQETIQAGGRVAFIADQNAGDDGIFVPFFGRLASSYKSIGLLAIHHRVPVVVGCAVRLDDRFKWRLECSEIIEPESWESASDPLFYITARYAKALETMVRRAPEQYLWIHRRWKSRPRFEREGRPFPANLRRKLEELPWMTQEDLRRLIDPRLRGTTDPRSGYPPS
jgi:KDO2-lipid IV(A) lauroyltransferase